MSFTKASHDPQRQSISRVKRQKVVGRKQCLSSAEELWHPPHFRVQLTSRSLRVTLKLGSACWVCSIEKNPTSSKTWIEPLSCNTEVARTCNFTTKATSNWSLSASCEFKNGSGLVANASSSARCLSKTEKNNDWKCLRKSMTCAKLSSKCRKMHYSRISRGMKNPIETRQESNLKKHSARKTKKQKQDRFSSLRLRSSRCLAGVSRQQYSIYCSKLKSRFLKRISRRTWTQILAAAKASHPPILAKTLTEIKRTRRGGKMRMVSSSKEPRLTAISRLFSK